MRFEGLSAAATPHPHTSLQSPPRAASGGAVPEHDARVVLHPQALVDQPLRLACLGLATAPRAQIESGKRAWAHADRERLLGWRSFQRITALALGSPDAGASAARIGRFIPGLRGGCSSLPPAHRRRKRGRSGNRGPRRSTPLRRGQTRGSFTRGSFGTQDHSRRRLMVSLRSWHSIQAPQSQSRPTGSNRSSYLPRRL
jgi:hypothetical protein